ncbi:MAG TPA: hypothetical protein VG206_11465 [Terriglobia bacterium]|nr:hypothetical protein [Terriglobia bacterium]
MGFNLEVGACTSLLSLVVLFPVALKGTTERGLLPYAGTPFVVLNFAYFVVASLAPLLFPNAYYGTISLNALPISLLILCAGFLSFAMGVLLSGSMARRQRSGSPGKISGLGVLTVVSSIALWITRTILATMGFGVTHVPTMVPLDSTVSQMGVLAGSVAYLPLSLCMARICSSSSPPHQIRVWRKYLSWVFITDILYYTLAGSRLGLLWEILIVVWVLSYRRVRIVPRALIPVLGLALCGALAVVYAERAALEGVHPELGENHLRLSRTYLPATGESLVGSNLWSTLEMGGTSDAGRLTAVGPFSGVAERVVGGRYSLMWGETFGAEMPLLIPHVFWPTKPIGEKIDFIINRNFDLFSLDELSSCETELIANFGVIGLCVGMLLYGIITERFCAPLSAGSALSERTIVLLLCTMPALFRVETDITSILVGLRVVVPVWAILRLLETRGRAAA